MCTVKKVESLYVCNSNVKFFLFRFGWSCMQFENWNWWIIQRLQLCIKGDEILGDRI